MAFVNRRAINRGEVVKRIFCALLTREHVLLQARTGVGKSLLANQVFELFEGANLFQVQASKEQQPDTYFGALDLDELKKGRIIHNTEGSLVESEFAFIDEIFDANDYTLRALLTLLNERRLVRGVQNVPAKIHTVVAAANYARITQVTEALLDRFLYKAVIEPDRDPFFMYRISQQFVLHRGKTAVPDARISLTMLKRLSSIVRGEAEDVVVSVPMPTLFFANLVLRHYESLYRQYNRQRGAAAGQVDFYISPRTQAKALDALRAIAIMNGRLEVLPEDVGKLHIMVTTAGLRDEYDLFKKAYGSLRKHYDASHAFEQLARLLELQDVLDRVTDDPALLEQPIDQVASAHVKRTLREWAKEKLGLGETGPEHNRRLLIAYLDGMNPLTDEIRSLKLRLREEVLHLYDDDELWQ